MADFLGRLAARALGQASSVEPRMPSRYEQVTEMPDEFVVDEPAFVADESAGSPAGAEERLTAPAPPTPRSEPRQPPGDRPVPSPAETVRPVVPEPVRPQRVVRVERVVAAETFHSGQAAPDEPMVTEGSTVEPAAGPIRRAVPARRSSVVPVPAAPVPPPPTGRSTRDTTVRISIGRIEVRTVPTPATPAVAVSRPASAAPAPAPTPVRAPEPAGLTLAAYLRGDRGRDQ
ncbi:MAG TPA: hypothetical protein VFC00_29155 [Micromonosporaceae bacterium]|nr:hypothetical protein [Micromonosporaceae bacterium]